MEIAQFIDNLNLDAYYVKNIDIFIFAIFFLSRRNNVISFPVIISLHNPGDF